MLSWERGSEGSRKKIQYICFWASNTVFHSEKCPGCLSHLLHKAAAPFKLMVSVQDAFLAKCGTPSAAAVITASWAKQQNLFAGEMPSAGWDSIWGFPHLFMWKTIHMNLEPPKGLPHSQNKMIHPLIAELTKEQFGGSILNLSVMLQIPLLLFW